MRKDDKKLAVAWVLFLLVLIIFVVWTKFHYDSEKEKCLKYQCKIAITGAEIIKEPDSVVKDLPEIETKTETVDTSNDDRKFYEYSKYGDLPKISPDGMRVLDAYAAKGVPAESNKIFLVIQIDSFVSKEALMTAIQYLGDRKATFVIPHYHDELVNLVEVIRKNGHEFFLQIPTQSSIPDNKKSSVSPFLANAALDDLLGKLLCLLAATKYAIGIANTSTTLLTKSQRDMVIITEELSKRGLAFLDLEKSADVMPQLNGNPDTLISANADLAISDADVINIDQLANNMIVTVKLSSFNRFMEEFAKKSGFVIAPVSQYLRK